MHKVARLAPVLDHVAVLPLGGLLRLRPGEGPRVMVAGVRALDGAPRRVRLEVQRLQWHQRGDGEVLRRLARAVSK